MKKQFGKIFAILAAAAILILGMIAGRYLESSKKPELNTSAITAQISELSQLSTAELAYRGLVRYSQGEITFLTKKEFTMIYDANVKAGVDLGQVQMDIKGNKVSVTLPKAEIQDITIDPDSLEFYDEKFALFNFQDRQEKNNWDGSRYHGEENGGSTAYEGPYRTYAGTAQRKQPRGGLSWPLLLVLVILTCPLWGGLGLGLLGVFLGLLGACIGILAALLFSGLGLVVGGVVLLANAFLFQLGTPATAVVTAGAALMMTALGLLLTLGFFLLVIKVFPPCFRWCIDLIQRILHRGHTGGDRA